MADNTPQQNPGETTNSFNKGMMKDYNETFIAEGMYTHARNAVNNSHTGQIGVIGNEPSNLECITLPYALIGSIHLYDALWVVFTTDDTDSEIGLFDELNCSYKKIINAPCLNFKQSNLITGTYRLRFDCDKLIYWDDGLNPTRIMNIDDVPYKYTEKIINGCIQKTYSTELDCERLRIAPLIKQPCLTLKKGISAGNLLNASYQVCMAYTVNQVKVTDYLAISEVQSLFTHESGAGGLSLDVTVSNVDDMYDEFELVVIFNAASQTIAKSMGYYSTSQGTININTIAPELTSIALKDIIAKIEHVEKSDAMYELNGYLLRVGVYGKYKFNYQPQANNIRTKWSAVQYPANYYVKGGNKTSYMRDEVYSFFIRWVYNTGDKSESYHIPGRAAVGSDKDINGTADAFETLQGEQVKNWQVDNTGSVTSVQTSVLPDGGNVIASGDMAYWESAELYPADRPDIWDKLCGQPIRHHKFPDETVDPLLNTFSDSGNLITLLGVQFENITHPLDINGFPIESIVGYEILRGSREGQKSIVAKGLLNNMREYTIPGNTTKGLFQNYPYNDLRADDYLTTIEQVGGETGQVNVTSATMKKYKKDILSFHSPETTFSRPYLAVNELKIYGEASGTSNGYFEYSYKHPKFKLLTDFATVIGTIVGIVNATTIFTKGITVGANDKNSLGFTIGPLPPVPYYPDSVVGPGSTSTGVANVLNAVLYGIQTVGWVAETAQLVATFSTFAELEKEKLLDLMLVLVPKKQFAAQFNSHGFYSNFQRSPSGRRRKQITESMYIDPVVQAFNLEYQINNINRSSYVTIQTASDVENPISTIDSSRYILSKSSHGRLNMSQPSPIVSHYGALKVAIPSQYGQLESIKQMPISTCVGYTKPIRTNRYTSEVYFGGDIYINRFTEKNTFFFFNDWLFDQPDEYQYDYTQYQNIPYARFWVANSEYKGKLLDQSHVWRALDMRVSDVIYIKKGYFYLFNSGVRDFFVESEVNLAYRDWDDDIEKRHYDVYKFSDLTGMFRSDHVRAGNYYKYDYALSMTKLYSNYVSWGTMLPRTYYPSDSLNCYSYRPGKMIYSLPQADETIADHWRVFLPFNYKDFQTELTSVKKMNKTGAIMMFKSQSPILFMGVDQLETDQGLKVTLGDAGLFNQPLQNIVNADESYEYGSCQSRYSVSATQYGVFWVSQNQGKVFQYAGQLAEISNAGMKWWFAKYLPSTLAVQFPNYPYLDNPVIGVGVQTIYDNTNEILYITKKDYKPKIDLSYDADGFYANVKGAKRYYSLGDPDAFENASWTISYDPKSKSWVSFHDWIPTFLIPGRSHFMSVNGRSIWKHNIRCDSYCNFYGVDHPWEVEFVSATGQTVTTLRSIEYVLEAYKYYNDCKDKFHVLDRNFDEAIIYNSEQVSGVLQLNIKPKNNPLGLLDYPRVFTDYIDILYAKEENKYRFNQFWDITADRSEFLPLNMPDVPNIPMFNSDANGYSFKINPTYINYNKSPLERKKFRHMINKVFLRRKHNGNIKFFFKLSNQKIQQSFR